VTLTDLCRLAEKYGTDKAGYYTPFYSLLLDRRRPYVQAVLEIGIGTPAAMAHIPGYKIGASLRMWRDYFPNAQIFGADKDIAALFVDDRIKTLLCDQSNEYELLRMADRVAVPLDLIVDDGSHRPDDQIRTALTLLPKLVEGGIYIVEDVNAPAEVLEGLAGYNPAFVSFPACRVHGKMVVISG
jgi:hypothetical protein